MTGMHAMPVLGDVGKGAGFLAGNGEATAGILFAALNAEREEAGIANIWHYGSTIEMTLVGGEHWAIECVGPEAFHFYPGIARGDTVTWLNVWVAPDLSLEELTGRLNEVAASAKRKNLNA